MGFMYHFTSWIIKYAISCNILAKKEYYQKYMFVYVFIFLWTTHPEHLESTILYITDKIFLVSLSMLFREIVDSLLVFCENNKKKISDIL